MYLSLNNIDCEGVLGYLIDKFVPDTPVEVISNNWLSSVLNDEVSKVVAKAFDADYYLWDLMVGRSGIEEVIEDIKISPHSSKLVDFRERKFYFPSLLIEILEVKND